MPAVETKAANRNLAGDREHRLLTSFFVLYKTARIVEESNATFKRQATAFHEQLTGLANDEGNVYIKSIAGRCGARDGRGYSNSC